MTTASFRALEARFSPSFKMNQLQDSRLRRTLGAAESVDDLLARTRPVPAAVSGMARHIDGVIALASELKDQCVDRDADEVSAIIDAWLAEHGAAIEDAVERSFTDKGAHEAVCNLLQAAADDDKKRENELIAAAEEAAGLQAQMDAKKAEGAGAGGGAAGDASGLNDASAGTNLLGLGSVATAPRRVSTALNCFVLDRVMRRLGSGWHIDRLRAELVGSVYSGGDGGADGRATLASFLKDAPFYEHVRSQQMVLAELVRERELAEGEQLSAMERALRVKRVMMRTSVNWQRMLKRGVMRQWRETVRNIRDQRKKLGDYMFKRKRVGTEEVLRRWKVFVVLKRLESALVGKEDVEMALEQLLHDLKDAQANERDMQDDVKRLEAELKQLTAHLEKTNKAIHDQRVPETLLLIKSVCQQLRGVGDLALRNGRVALDEALTCISINKLAMIYWVNREERQHRAREAAQKEAMEKKAEADEKAKKRAERKLKSRKRKQEKELKKAVEAAHAQADEEVRGEVRRENRAAAAAAGLLGEDEDEGPFETDVPEEATELSECDDGVDSDDGMALCAPAAAAAEGQIAAHVGQCHQKGCE